MLRMPTIRGSEVPAGLDSRVGLDGLSKGRRKSSREANLPLLAEHPVAHPVVVIAIDDARLSKARLLPLPQLLRQPHHAPVA